MGANRVDAMPRPHIPPGNRVAGRVSYVGKASRAYGVPTSSRTCPDRYVAIDPRRLRCGCILRAAGAYADAMREADDQFTERLAADLERILGTGILLESVDLGPDDGPSRIRAVCLFDGGSEVIEAAGETRVAAYSELIRLAGELRLAIAARRMIAPM